MHGIMRPVATFLAGAIFAISGIFSISRRDAACITHALHPAQRTVVDPMYRQELKYFPLEWECTWTDLPGHPATTSFDPFATVLYFAGALIMIIALIWATSLTIARRRKA